MAGRLNALIVEDDAGIRQSLFETLTALGFMVGEASNGEQALARLRMADYDAVLLDINICLGWEESKPAAEFIAAIHTSLSSCSPCGRKRTTKWKRSMRVPMTM